MKFSRTITFASGVLVVVTVLIFLSREKTSRKSRLINSRTFAISRLFAPADYSSCSGDNKSTKNIKQDGGERQIYILAFQLAAFFGLSNERTLRNETTSSTSPGFAVVELFTSQGCSSCPPADELIKNIVRDDRTGQIYVLAFHVDYWDHQGWKDRFSEKEFSNRQIQYAGWLNLQTLYTPQAVVNGVTEHVGSDKGSVLKAISAGLAQEATSKLEMKSWIEGNQIYVEYLAVTDDKSSELVLTLVRKSAQVSVKAGENRGRSLSHVQIVRKMTRLPLNENSKKVASIKPPVDFTENGWEIIGFIQRTSDGMITSAGRLDFK